MNPRNEKRAHVPKTLVHGQLLFPPNAQRLVVSPSGEVWLAGVLSGYGSFLRGYSAIGAFPKETLTGFCGEPTISIYAIRSDPTGGLRILSEDGLTAIKP